MSKSDDMGIASKLTLGWVLGVPRKTRVQFINQLLVAMMHTTETPLVVVTNRQATWDTIKICFFSFIPIFPEWTSTVWEDEE